MRCWQMGQSCEETQRILAQDVPRFFEESEFPPRRDNIVNRILLKCKNCWKTQYDKARVKCLSLRKGSAGIRKEQSLAEKIEEIEKHLASEDVKAFQAEIRSNTCVATEIHLLHNFLKSGMKIRRPPGTDCTFETAGKTYQIEVYQPAKSRVASLNAIQRSTPRWVSARNTEKAAEWIRTLR